MKKFWTPDLRRPKWRMRLASLLMAMLLVCGSALAVDFTYKDITVRYSGVKINLDGQQIVPKDVNGNIVEPFIYNGTTFVPVRAISEAYGKDVSFDSATQTVMITDPVTSSLLPYKTPAYGIVYSGEGSDTFTMMGKAYNAGVTLDVYWRDQAYFNLDKKYSTLTYIVGPLDSNRTFSGSVSVYLDDVLSDTYELSSSSGVIQKTLNVANVSQLRIETDRSNAKSGDRFGFAEIHGQ